VLVNGAAGAVGLTAAQLATTAGARVIATVRRESDADLVRTYCAAEVLSLSGTTADEIRSLVPDGVDHIVEVAFDANVALDAAVVRQGATIAAYASVVAEPKLPFWTLLFANVTLRLVGSDDLTAEARRRAAETLTAAVAAGTLRFPVAATLPLAETATAHELVERPAGPGKVVVAVR
jgi:NADPH2:quinone reductase